MLTMDSKHCSEQKSGEAVPYPDVAWWAQHILDEWWNRYRTRSLARVAITAAQK